MNSFITLPMNLELIHSSISTNQAVIDDGLGWLSSIVADKSQEETTKSKLMQFLESKNNKNNNKNRSVQTMTSIIRPPNLEAF